MKVLINKCYGGYGFSDEFIKHLIKNDIIKNFMGQHYLNRHNQELIKEAVAFGLDKASGMCAELEVKDVPDGANYSIHEYDGMECIDNIWIEVSLHDLKYGLKQHQIHMIKQGCDIKPTKLNEI
jgi:hypothetical protein